MNGALINASVRYLTAKKAYKQARTEDVVERYRQWRSAMNEIDEVILRANPAELFAALTPEQQSDVLLRARPQLAVIWTNGVTA